MYDQYVPGDIIPSAAMNAAINQGIIPFANAAARDAAIPSPTIGMTCFLSGSGTVQRHNGFVWVGDEAVVQPTWLNGWARATNSTAYYHMDASAQVTMIVNASYTGTPTNRTLFTIPAGYRPKQDGIYAPMVHNGATYAGNSLLAVIPDGSVLLASQTPLVLNMVVYATLTYQVDFLAVR